MKLGIFIEEYIAKPQWALKWSKPDHLGIVKHIEAYNFYNYKPILIILTFMNYFWQDKEKIMRFLLCLNISYGLKDIQPENFKSSFFALTFFSFRWITFELNTRKFFKKIYWKSTYFSSLSIKKNFKYLNSITKKNCQSQNFETCLKNGDFFSKKVSLQI